MTQTGKCDTCRQRKVKCDEGKPKCGACCKKDRSCSYTYGKASAFVVQDPNQLTKHGKSKIAPVIYALDTSEDNSSLSGSTLELRVSTQKKAEFGSGIFQTLAPASVAKTRPSKKAAVHKKKAFNAYLRHLQLQASLAAIKPSSAEGILVTRWVDMLGSGPTNSRPLSILGTWIQSIPSRVGSNRMVDLAVEFLIDSNAVYWDDSYSKRQIASATKSRALKELQLAVSQAQGRNMYEMVLATKMHYAAETLLGVDTMYHAIHAFGLAELLKAGGVSNVDDEHYWNLIDNTYIDDVNEAMLAGRASVYDNDYYLSTTHPPALAPEAVLLEPAQRASMAIMHVFVQCPRLNCLVRHTLMNPEDPNSLAAAVTLTEYLWLMNLPMHVAGLIQNAVTVVGEPPSSAMADILVESLHFDSVQSMILCTRYWMLQNVLCGLTDTLHRHFPTETALSLLPNQESVRAIDRDAGLRLAESLSWAESISQKLPLVPLRLHTPLQISIGPWHRTIRYITSLFASDCTLATGLDPRISNDLARALRMKTWLIEEYNRIHEQWDVSTVDEKSLSEALDSMAGEEIPDWLPTRIRFEAEDGDMVIKLDYDQPTGKQKEQLSLDGSSSIAQLASCKLDHSGTPNTDTHGVQDAVLSVDCSPSSADIEELNPGSETLPSLGPADFLFKSGRNLCSTSGWWPTPNASPEAPTDADATLSCKPYMPSSWWPQTPQTSVVLLDSTHKTSAFQPKAKRSKPRVAVTFENRKMNGCMSPAWTSTNDSLISSKSSDQERFSDSVLPKGSGGT